MDHTHLIKEEKEREREGDNEKEKGARLGCRVLSFLFLFQSFKSGVAFIWRRLQTAEVHQTRTEDNWTKLSSLVELLSKKKFEFGLLPHQLLNHSNQTANLSAAIFILLSESRMMTRLLEINGGSIGTRALYHLPSMILRSPTTRPLKYCASINLKYSSIS